jgi:hypothetical protein
MVPGIWRVARVCRAAHLNQGRRLGLGGLGRW